jgi:superfamily II DNA or RNA helicase
LNPGTREAYARSFRDFEDRLNFWHVQMGGLRLMKPEAKGRFAQDIHLALSLLSDRLLRFGALVFSEPISDSDLSGFHLRSRLLPPREETPPAPPRPKPEHPADSRILPALVNHDVGFGRELSLRIHQHAPLKAVVGWFDAQRHHFESGVNGQDFLNATVVMPVGGGKTRLMVAALASAIERGLFQASRGDKFVLLNHTDQIHRQNLGVLELLKPHFKNAFRRELRITEYKAKTKDPSGDVVVASLPTINNDERLAAFKAAMRKALSAEGRIAVACVDEVHHVELGAGAGRESWRRALEALREISPSFYRLGFTATPTRKEPHVLYRVSERALMRAGVTPRTYLVRVPGIDLQQLKVSQATGDFQERELASALLGHPERNAKLYEALEAKGLRAQGAAPSGKHRLEPVLGFAADLAHAAMMMEDYRKFFRKDVLTLGKDKGKISRKEWIDALTLFREGRVDAIAAVISGGTRNRDEILKAVERGEVEAVFTVDALVEGADLHMFRHQLGARPTLSRIKKGQERGRINRRGLQEVGPRGELLEDPPRILFDVVDRYLRHEQYLVHYGMVMGVRFLNAPEEEFLDAMTDQRVDAVDREGGAVTRLSPEEWLSKGPNREPPETPKESPWTPMIGLLREILGSRYGDDLEEMARDLGETEEFLADLLAEKGWENNQWFFRRLATLLYQEREVFVRCWNRALGRRNEEEKRRCARVDAAEMIASLREVLGEAERGNERLSPSIHRRSRLGEVRPGDPGGTTAE